MFRIISGSTYNYFVQEEARAGQVPILESRLVYLHADHEVALGCLKSAEEKIHNDARTISGLCEEITQAKSQIRELTEALKKAQEQSQPRRVFLRYREGRLASVHLNRDSAHSAAEAEGAHTDGWVYGPPAPDAEWLDPRLSHQVASVPIDWDIIAARQLEA